MIVLSACIKQRQLQIERMPTILTRALSWALSGFGNTFKLDKRLRVRQQILRQIHAIRDGSIVYC